MDSVVDLVDFASSSEGKKLLAKLPEEDVIGLSLDIQYTSGGERINPRLYHKKQSGTETKGEIEISGKGLMEWLQNLTSKRSKTIENILQGFTITPGK